jgi:hypothetical protein
MALSSISLILTYLLPAVVLYFAVRYAVRAYLQNTENKRNTEKKLRFEETMLPLRLQASERLILLLERITPVQAINRAMQPGMSSYELQINLLRNIREEFEHNTAQQLYVSQHCWAMIKSAKEEVIRLVNLSVTEAGEGANAGEVAQKMLLHWSNLEQDPIQTAINQVKKEIFVES